MSNYLKKSTRKVTTTLIYSPTAVADCNQADIFKLALSGNVVLGTPINPINGKSIIYHIKQNAIGSNTITLRPEFIIPSSATIPLAWSTTANYMDILTVLCDTDLNKFYIVSLIPGYNS